MTTTILGASGKLGRILTAFTRKSGLDWRTQTRNPGADVVWSGSFSDPAAAVLFRPGANLINMIGYAGSDQGLLQDTNVRFVENLLGKAAETGVSHIILASSAGVYGGKSKNPYHEDCRLDPTSPYGKSKVAMEQIARTFAAQHAVPSITIARIGNVAGADALAVAARRYIATNTAMPLHRFSNGMAPVRSYIGPRDLFEVIRGLSAPFKGPPRIVNVAHPQPVGLDAVLAAYRKHVLPDLRWVDAPVPDGVPANVTLATEQAQRFVCFQDYDDPADELGRQVAEYLTL